MSIDRNYYRASRLSLYHDCSNLELGEAKKLGAFAKSITASDAEIKNRGMGAVPESCQAHIIDYNEYIEVKARFELDQKAYVLLKQGEEELVYSIEIGNRFALRSCTPYISRDERNTNTIVYREGLSGSYDINIVIDGDEYETGVKFTV